MMIQLIYMSAAAHKLSSSELAELLTNSRMKNELLGISGMLVYHDGVFLQILEGESSAVDGVYNRIGHDQRHKNCQLLMRSSIDKRSFGQWRMGFVNTNEFRNTAKMFGFQDLLSLNCDSPNPSLAHKLLLDFRDVALKEIEATAC